MNDKPEEVLLLAPRSTIPPKDVSVTARDESEQENRDVQQVIQSLGLQVQLGQIPQKMEFKIGEVAQLLGIKTFVLRFWETEFDALRPTKSKNNQRVYRRRDVETALLIKTLLYDERYSIEGARAALRKVKQQLKQTEHVRKAVMGQEVAVQKLRTILNRIRNLRDRIGDEATAKT